MSRAIDHRMFKQLAEAGVISALRVVAQREGWEVIAIFGGTEGVLTGQRRKVRIFRNLNTVALYLSKMGIHKYQIDADRYDPVALKSSRHNELARERLNFAYNAVRIATKKL